VYDQLSHKRFDADFVLLRASLWQKSSLEFLIDALAASLQQIPSLDQLLSSRFLSEENQNDPRKEKPIEKQSRFLNAHT
jgi:hypothetical protein